jgi:Zn-dependent protease
VRFRVLGFPVHIDLTFVVIMGLIGWLSGADSAARILVWLGVAALAVLLHELGHAVVARTTGAHPVIALTGFGGVTMYSPPGPLTRARSLSISLAGPLVGLAVGVPLLLVRREIGGDLEPGGLAAEALWYAVFTTLAWSVLNLLPVLPLDGGQAMRELLPGSPEVRARRAAVVSLAVLVPLFAFALYSNQPFLAVFLLIFGFGNLQALRAGSGRDGRAGARPAAAQADPRPEGVVVGLLWQGATVQARTTLEALPEGQPVDLAIHGAVMATTGEIQQGLALLEQERRNRPDDANVVALVVLTHVLLHDWEAVMADLASGYAPLIPLAVVERAMQEATTAGRPDVAARLGAVPRHP